MYVEVGFPMYREIINYLCCPVCRNNLHLRADSEIDGDVITGLLTCEVGHSYRIHKGVADFNSDEQGFANQWEELGDGEHFDEFDSQVDARNPAQVIERRKLVLDSITGAVSVHKPKILLDIASGRGLILTELVKALDFDTHILSIDLSKFVLQYDHRKFKQMAPDAKISFLACDATNLPLKDFAVDAATTYCGFSNMVGCAGEALGEAHRVLKPAGILLDSYVVIEKESKGYELLHQVCAQQQLSGAEAFFIHENVVKHHEALFSGVDCKRVFEGLGVGNDMDLLPYDGEWYAEEVLISTK